ncbi:MAG: iron-sulfur cluster insertion protein ErpA [Arsenophonus sp.]|nr:MAG: iron-sulfur cluster insertion protein ErpA [Arsenophonus sp.]
MIKEKKIFIELTKKAIEKIKKSTSNKKDNNNLHFRIYIIGGGCNGFQYGFTFDNKINEDDFKIIEKGIKLVIDPTSMQYLVGSCIDYIEELKESKFTIINPNAKITCSCGSSFDV